MLLAVAAVAGAMYVAAALGGAKAGVTLKQYSALKKEVTSLSSKVKTLQQDVGSQASTVSSLSGTVTTLNTTVTSDDSFITSCLKAADVVGVSEFGDPAGSAGYAYSNDGSNIFWTTALDLDSTSPGGYLQLVAPSCVSAGAAAQKQGAQTERARSFTARQR